MTLGELCDFSSLKTDEMDVSVNRLGHQMLTVRTGDVAYSTNQRAHISSEPDRTTSAPKWVPCEAAFSNRRSDLEDCEALAND
jgi:hypothetical protein